MADDHFRNRIEDWLNRDAGLGTGRLYAGRLDAALGTAIGRRVENQDRCLVMTAAFPAAPERNLCLAALCDGMGGMANGGAYASQALAAFTASVVQGFDRAPEDRLTAAAEAANDAVHADRSGHGGATLSAVLIDGKGHTTAVNVGDSRIYGLNASRRPTQITTDDTLSAHLDAIRGGDHSDIPKGDQLVQYIGMGPGLEPHVIPVPATSDDPAPDCLLITSDGAHYFGEGILRRILGAAEDIDQAVERLMTLTEWLGGRDNAAAIMAPMDRLSDFAPDDPPAYGLIEIWGPFGKVEFSGDIVSVPKPAPRKTTPRKTTPRKTTARKTANAGARNKSAPPKRQKAAATPATEEVAPTAKKPAAKPGKTAPPSAKASPVKAKPYRPKSGGSGKSAPAGSKTTAKTTAKRAAKPAAKTAPKPAPKTAPKPAKPGLNIKISGGR